MSWLWLVAALATAVAGWKLLVAAGQDRRPALGLARVGFILFLLGAWGAVYSVVALTTSLI